MNKRIDELSNTWSFKIIFFIIYKSKKQLYSKDEKTQMKNRRAEYETKKPTKKKKKNRYNYDLRIIFLIS